ncbi:hypothetical protein HDU96_007455 [Phlyctochytrium bullatum]|nr:hypothetical protein HDU96_007455 [Phlyctochytrium bullatum]
MGCSASIPQSNEVAESKLVKRRALKAIDNGERWRSSLVEFLDALEKSGFVGALWAEDEHDNVFVDVFKKFSLNLTELSVISRSFLTALDDHLVLLTDLLALQREYHDAVKKCVTALASLQAIRHRAGTKSTKIQGGRSTNVAPPRTSPAASAGRNVVRGGRGEGGGFLGLFPGSGSTRRRSSVVSPEGDSSAESLDAHLDVRAEARAQVDVNEAIKTLAARRDRLDRVKASRLPGSLVDLLAGQGAMWKRASEVFGSMKEVGLAAGWSAGEVSSVQIDQPHPSHQTFFISLEDQTNRQRQNIERPFYLTILEGWSSVLQYHMTVEAVGISRQLQGPALAAYNSLVSFTRTLFQIQVREEDAIKKIKALATASSKNKSFRKGVRVGPVPSRRGIEEELDPEIGVNGTIKRKSMRRGNPTHQLETERHRLSRILSDNRAFRKSGLARVQMEMWVSLEGSVREIGGNYTSAASSFERLSRQTPGSNPFPPAYDGVLAAEDTRIGATNPRTPSLAPEQSPVTLLVTSTGRTSRDTVSVRSNVAPSLPSRVATQKGSIMAHSISSINHSTNGGASKANEGRRAGSVGLIGATGTYSGSHSNYAQGGGPATAVGGSLEQFSRREVNRQSTTTNDRRQSRHSVRSVAHVPPRDASAESTEKDILSELAPGTYEHQSRQGSHQLGDAAADPSLPHPNSVNAHADDPQPTERMQRRRSSLTDGMLAQRASVSNPPNGHDGITHNTEDRGQHHPPSPQAQAPHESTSASYMHLRPRPPLPPIGNGAEKHSPPHHRHPVTSTKGASPNPQAFEDPANMMKDTANGLTEGGRPSMENSANVGSRPSVKGSRGAVQVDVFDHQAPPSRVRKGPPPPPPHNPMHVKEQPSSDPGVEKNTVYADQLEATPKKPAASPTPDPDSKPTTPSHPRPVTAQTKAYSIGTTDELYAPRLANDFGDVSAESAIGTDADALSEGQAVHNDMPHPSANESISAAAAPGSLMAALEARRTGKSPVGNPAPKSPPLSMKLLETELKALSPMPFVQDTSPAVPPYARASTPPHPSTSNGTPLPPPDRKRTIDSARTQASTSSDNTVEAASMVDSGMAQTSSLEVDLRSDGTPKPPPVPNALTPRSAASSASSQPSLARRAPPPPPMGAQQPTRAVGADPGLLSGQTSPRRKPPPPPVDGKQARDSTASSASTLRQPPPPPPPLRPAPNSLFTRGWHR